MACERLLFSYYGVFDGNEEQTTIFPYVCLTIQFFFFSNQPNFYTLLMFS
jgi:hypothetical protein